MPSVTGRTRRVVVAAALGLVAAAGLGSPAIGSAAGQPRVAAPSLWGIELSPRSPLMRERELSRLRKSGVDAVVVDGRRTSSSQRRRLGRAAARLDMTLVVARTQLGSGCRADRRDAALCAVVAKSVAAVSRREARAADLVLVRVRTPRDVRALAPAPAGRRVVAVVDARALPKFDRTMWRDAIVHARAGGDLQLAVSAPAAGELRAVAAFRALLAGLPTTPPDSPPAEAPSPTAPAAPAPAPSSPSPASPSPSSPAPWSPPANSGPAPADGVASVFVSASGSDASSCTSAAPCRSFDRAYRVADPGDVVEVAAGTYPDQVVGVDASKASGPDVLFRPRAGARVVVESDLDVLGSHIEFRGLEVADNWYAKQGSHHLTFRNIDTERLMIASASDIQVLGGDYGPSLNSVSQIKSAAESAVAPTRILLDGLNVHDYTRNDPAQHMECLHVMAADQVTIRNSRFDDCSIFGISFNHHGASAAMRSIVVENNWFGDVLDGGSYAVHFSSGKPCEATVRFNTFADGGLSQECPEIGAGVSIHSNILSRSPSAGAVNGYSWDYNVYQSGSRIGLNDLVADVTFVDEANFDLHLKPGSAAIDRGHPASAPGTDIDSQARANRPDAGADEQAAA